MIFSISTYLYSVFKSFNSPEETKPLINPNGPYHPPPIHYSPVHYPQNPSYPTTPYNPHYNHGYNNTGYVPQQVNAIMNNAPPPSAPEHPPPTSKYADFTQHVGNNVNPQ